MELVDSFRGKVLALDTAIFIYIFENRRSHQAFLDAFLKSHEHGDFLIVTSMVTLIETLVLPLREKKASLVKKYKRTLLDTLGLETIAVRSEIAVKAAELRVKYALKTPDSIQLATALWAKADFFLTNDKDLRKVREIKIVFLDDLAHSN